MQRLAARRARLGDGELLRVGLAFVLQHVDDFRDDVAAFFDDDRVADAHVLARELVEVVQRRVHDLRAADAHGIELRDRRDGAGASDIQVDVADDRLRGFGRILERDRPARRTGSNSATGVTVPVRPTYKLMLRTIVCAASGGYLNATAQRGAFDVAPSSSCSSRRFTFTTMPSISKSRS